MILLSNFRFIIIYLYFYYLFFNYLFCILYLFIYLFIYLFTYLLIYLFTLAYCNTLYRRYRRGRIGYLGAFARITAEEIENFKVKNGTNAPAYPSHIDITTGNKIIYFSIRKAIT